MPSAVLPNPRAVDAELDELDALFNEPASNHDRAVDSFMRDVRGEGDDHPNLNTTNGEEHNEDPDAEIKVRKQRKPNPKLDEALLTSDKGIQKLRRTARAKLKFKGKGHEFSDMSRLLTTYQLWLDDIYPKAKFRDGLTMVEKLGHSKRMQVMRKAWIDETKPVAREESPERLGDGLATNDNLQGMRDQSVGDVRMNADAARADAGAARESESRHDIDEPEDDELDALSDEQRAASALGRQSAQPTRRGPFEDDDEPDEDDFDALMAENVQQAPVKPAGSVQKAKGPLADGEPDEDELDALMAEDGNDAVPSALTDAPHPVRRQDVFADDEEAMAGMW